MIMMTLMMMIMIIMTMMIMIIMMIMMMMMVMMTMMMIIMIVTRGQHPWSFTGRTGPQPDGGESCLAILNNVYRSVYSVQVYRSVQR